MQNPLEDILKLDNRKILVCSTEIDLFKLNENQVFVLFIEESRGSAGGRAGGSGSRKISQISSYECRNQECKILFDTRNQDEISAFEIPYSAVAMDIKLSNNCPMVVQGLIDPSLIKSYNKLITKF